MYFASLEASMELAKVEGPYSTYEGSPMSRGVIQPGKPSLHPDHPMTPACHLTASYPSFPHPAYPMTPACLTSPPLPISHLFSFLYLNRYVGCDPV